MVSCNRGENYGNQRHHSKTAHRKRTVTGSARRAGIRHTAGCLTLETGETVPNTETLKLLSKLFRVSINTLLGSPQTLICQCCGMPLDDSTISTEPDGAFNEEYCKWCYSDGQFAYTDMGQLTDFLVQHMSNDSTPPEQVRSYLERMLPTLRHWQE